VVVSCTRCREVRKVTYPGAFSRSAAVRRSPSGSWA